MEGRSSAALVALSEAQSLLEALIAQEDKKADRNRKQIHEEHELPGLDRNTNARPAACEPCRRSRTKCVPQLANQSTDNAVCQRCYTSQLDCIYAPINRSGRKRVGTVACRLAKEAAMAVQTAIAALDNAKTVQPNLASPFSHQEEAILSSAVTSLNPDEDDHITTNASVLDNPLATLASCAEDTPQDNSLSATLQAVMHAHDATAPKKSWRAILYDHNALRTAPSRRNSPPGSPIGSSLLPLQSWHQKIVTRLYQERTDASDRHDPIALNLVTEKQAELLVAFYFDNLRQWIHLLEPSIHSLSYLRTRSPLLLTAVCLVSAYFDDKYSHLAHHLSMHIDTLLARILTEGFRSIELVQGLCLLAAWAPARDDADTERAWSLIGLAIRMATEIRLDYRLSQTSTTGQLDPSEIDREKTWMLLCVSDISLALSTGRSRGLSTTQFSNILRQPRSEIPQEVQCLFTLRVLVAYGMDRITTLLSSGKCKIADREDFLKRWSADVASMTSPCPPGDLFMGVLRQHAHLIIYCSAQRFQGDKRELLSLCRRTAIDLLEGVLAWKDGTRMSNYFIGHVAYAAAVLCRLVQIEYRALQRQYIENALQICRKIAGMLSDVGGTRLCGKSIASVHSINIARTVAEIARAVASLDSSSALTETSTALLAESSEPNFNIDSFLNLDFDWLPWTEGIDTSMMLPLDENIFGTEPAMFDWTEAYAGKQDA